MEATLKDILFLDIETIRCVENFASLNEQLKAQWVRKASFLKREEAQTDQDLFEEKAGIYAEFGKVITIAMGYFAEDENGNMTLRIKSLANHNEALLLEEFKTMLEKFNQDAIRLCAHNGKEFDFPYLSRRLLINGIKLPGSLNLSGKKPWEVNHLDTLDMWKFGDRKHYTPLALLAHIFDIPSSKEQIDGSMVSQVYYEQDGLDSIAEYCAKDVAVTAQVYLKIKGLPSIQQKDIFIV